MPLLLWGECWSLITAGAPGHRGAKGLSTADLHASARPRTHTHRHMQKQNTDTHVDIYTDTQRDRKTQRHTQTYTQGDTQTHKHKITYTDTHKKSDTRRHTETHRHTCKHIHRGTCRHTPTYGCTDTLAHTSNTCMHKLTDRDKTHTQTHAHTDHMKARRRILEVSRGVNRGKTSPWLLMSPVSPKAWATTCSLLPSMTLPPTSSLASLGLHCLCPPHPVCCAALHLCLNLSES